MRFWQVEGSFGIENLKLADAADPHPGPGEVLVRIRAAALNYRDLLMATGRYDPRIPLPYIPLSDAAGTIAETGAGVTNLKPGERVMILPSVDWFSGPPDRGTPHRTLGGRLNGTLADFICPPAHAVLPLPEHLSYAEGAAFPCAGLTAWSALVTHGGLRAGQTVLVQGTGGVSLFAAQFALLHGARVLATTGSASKTDQLRSLGVHGIVNYKETPDWDKRVRELTNGIGVDHIVEVGGAGTLEKSLQCIKPGGAIALIGVLAGSEKPLNLLPAIMRNVRMQGILIGHRESMEAMNHAVALHKMKPVIDQVIPFHDSPRAFERLLSSEHTGKICIQMEE